MTGRELILLAAKAVGFRITWGETYILGDDEVDCTDLPYIMGADREEADSYWNPLEDDGDALRLAVSLSIDVMHRFVGGRRCEALAPGGEVVQVFYQTFDDPNAATRRAIVQAAAAIGGSLS